jgi:membrane protein required for beta-lactamase induction
MSSVTSRVTPAMVSLPLVLTVNVVPAGATSVDVAREYGAVAHHDVIAQDAIVRDVARREQRVMGSDSREIAIVRRAVHRHVLAQHIAVANPESGISAPIL